MPRTTELLVGRGRLLSPAGVVAQVYPATQESAPQEWAPAELLDLAWIEGVAVEEWQKLFRQAGWPAELSRKNLSHGAILRALGRRPPDALLDALQLAYDPGTPDGIEQLVQTATSERIPREDLDDATNPADCLLRL